MIGHFDILGPGILATFYAAIAALLAMVFALLFSFSLFAVQHAAANYFPELLNDFKRDKRGKRLFIVFGVAVALNLLLVVWRFRSLLSVLGSLALAVLGIVMLGSHYHYIIDLINPLRLAERLADRARATLKSVLSVPPGQQHRIPEMMKRVSPDVEGVFDLVYRAVDKRELQTTRHGLGAICDIADEYCKATKDIPRRDDDFLLSLPGICERLFSLATVAVKDENVETLSQIVFAYHRISLSALQVHLPVTPARRTHDLAYRVIGYLRHVSERALGVQLTDVGMAAARSLGDVAAELARRGYIVSALTLCKFLEGIGVLAVNTGSWQAANYCSAALSSVVVALLSNDNTLDHDVASALDNIKALSMHATRGDPQHCDFITQPFISRLSETSPAGLADLAAARFSEADGDKLRRWRFGQLQDTVEALVRVSEEIGCAFASSGLNALVDEVRDALEQVGGVCIEVQLEGSDGQFPRTLRRELGRVELALSQIWGAFPTATPLFGHRILETLAKLTIEASEKGMDGEAEQGVRILAGIAKQSADLGRKVAPYEPPRQAVYVAMVGIYGVRHGKEGLIDRTFECLRDFLIAFAEGWPNETHRLEQELRELRTEWNEFRYTPSLDPWKTYFFPKITGQDIDTYTERLIGFLTGEPASQPGDSA